MTPARHALAVIVTVALPLPAHAQSASAEALFREGRALIKQGKLADGCAKLAASEQLESSVGTLLNVGDCWEQQGKLASAWAAFRKAESLAKQSGHDPRRQAEARRRAARLEPDLANLEIDVPHPSEGLIVRRNGDPVAPAGWNTAVPVDPGAYTIVAEAPGRKPWRTEIAVAPGRSRQLSIPGLERVPEPVAPVPRPSPLAAPAPTVVLRSAEPVAITTPAPSRWTTPRKVAVGFAAASIAAVVGGVYFGVDAHGLAKQSDQICPFRTCGDAEGLRLNRDAQTEATRANILYAAGGLAAATAMVMWFVGAPDERPPISPTIGTANGARQIGATFTGRF